MKITLILCALLYAYSLSPQILAQERGEVPPYTHFGSKKASLIDDFVSRYQKAWRELDAELFSELHARDTEWTNAFARIFRGREALYNFVKTQLFPLFSQTQDDTSSLVLHQISSRALSDSIAVLHLYTDFGSPTEGNARRVHFHLVLNKDEDRWEVVHTAIMDPRN